MADDDWSENWDDEPPVVSNYGDGGGRGRDFWRRGNVHGNEHQFPRRQQYSYNDRPSTLPENYQQTFGRGSMPHRVNGGRHNDGRYQNIYGRNGEEMLVSSSDLGLIIGKAGSTIKKIQEDTGAKLKILKNCEENYQTPIQIQGDEEQIKLAKNMIDDAVSGSYKAKKTKPVTQNTSGEDFNIDWSAVIQKSNEFEAQKFADAAPIIKDFYIEDSVVANMTHSEVRELRMNSMNISVNDLIQSGGKRDIPNPVLQFDQAFKHYPEILEELDKQGFTNPSPIQMQAWPIILKGLDMIGIAQTGTGKTLAFLLPAYIHIEAQPTPRKDRVGPTVLCLSPTRELALQIEQEVKKYTYKDIRSMCIYGGGDRRAQIKECKKGIEIVIATPGRLNDLIINDIIDVKGVSYLILDEADKMLDMGFEPEIRKILIDIRPDRQTIMTSATWPEGVRRMASNYLRDPMQVIVGSLDLAAVHTVTQTVEIIDADDKKDRLFYFLSKELGSEDKVIVFCSRKTTCDDIASDLCLKDINCQSIHGDREQYDREQALSDLKCGEVNILIATDVASRGIDIKDITFVVNYDFPRNIEDYVHRVGRTGRAGRKGHSITLMTRQDWRNAKDLIDILHQSNQEIPMELEEMAERYSVWQRKKQREDEEGRNMGRGGGSREPDWLCPEMGCSESNFASRFRCRKCNQPKPNGGGYGGHSQRRGGSRRGGRDQEDQFSSFFS